MPLTRDDRKISIIGGLLLMGLTLTTGIAVYDVMRQQIESTLGRGLDVALQGKAHLLESQIEKGLADTHAIVTRPFLIQSMQQLGAQPDETGALHDLQRNIDSLLLAGFTAAIVYDTKGRELSRVGNFSGNRTPVLPLSKENKTSLLWDGQFILRTSEAVFDQEGRLIGSITTENTLPQLTRSFGEIRTIGTTGEFVLCAPPGKNEVEMACLISQLDGVKFRQLSRVISNDVLPMQSALEGKSGVIAVKDYRQISVIEAYAPLRAIGLGMVLKLDEDELFKPVNEQLKIIVLYLAGLIIAEILLLNWFVRKLVKSEQEARSAKEKAEQYSVVLSHKELELRERLKEITCLYGIRRGMTLELSIDDACQNIFEHLIPAVQFPEIATAVIELDGWQFSSGNYQQHSGHLVQSKTRIRNKVRGHTRITRNPACTCWSAISVNDKICGNLRIYYPEDKPFLMLEEQRLINAIASELESWLERKRLEQALVSVAEEHQRMLGQELHDNVGQQIAAIGYQARALEKKIFTSGDVDMASVAASIAAQAQVAVVQMKQLAQGLLPFELETNGLIEALRTFATTIATTYKIDCDFRCTEEVLVADKNLALNLYRITQEAANNAIRHGGAKHLIISLVVVEGILHLSICDDGCGFSDSDGKLGATSGMGIRIMQYRAKQQGAKLEFLSRSEGGVEVHLTIRMV